MDRREYLRLMISGSLGAGFFLNKASEISQNDHETSQKIISEDGGGYGRTEAEIERDNRLHAESFFTEHELKTVAVLADIIIPADDVSGSATDAGVPEFMEFIMKDMPNLQIPTRGGIMWLDNESRKSFGKNFIYIRSKQQIELIDDIAFPDDARPEMEFGVRFFNRMRNLTATGFFTSEMGTKDLDYQGNKPNVWDGVPESVLQYHGMSYDKKTLDECLRYSERGTVAKWDENMNLIRE